MAATLPKPDGPCPKCGDESWMGPRFQGAMLINQRDAADGMSAETMIYNCGTCQYQVKVPPLDAAQQ